MKPQIILLIIIIGLFIFFLGGVAGFIYSQPNSTVLQIKAPGDDLKMAAIQKTLNSGIIPLLASGTVTEISGQDITISENGKSLAIPINKSARIYSRKDSTIKQPVVKPAKIEDILIGDYLVINLRVSDDGILEGMAVAISFPPESVNITK